MMDAHTRMIDKFLDKLFEKRKPLTEEEMDDMAGENGVLMVWEDVKGFKKVIICQAGNRKTLIEIGKILSRNGYEAEVR
jgi:hypothetical protein